MHPEVIKLAPGKCPKCGMKLVPSDAPPAAGSPEGQANSGHEHGDHGDGLEWEDLIAQCLLGDERSGYWSGR